MADMRKFETGATRNVDVDGFDLEGFLSPIVLMRYSEYMHKHRKQADGKLRDSDNWQKGIPLFSYMKSGTRHFMDWWMAHRGFKSREGLEEGICALLFNAMGYLHETLKKRGYKQLCPSQLSLLLEGTGSFMATDGRNSYSVPGAELTHPIPKSAHSVANHAQADSQ